MEVKAISKNVRISASKGRDLARVIKGKRVSEAIKMMDFSPRKAAALLSRTIKSAAANASHNAGLDVDTLIVVTAVFDEGAKLRRYWSRARGSASPIDKQSSHITVVLSDGRE